MRGLGLVLRLGLAMWSLAMCAGLPLGSTAWAEATPRTGWDWPLAGGPPVDRRFDPPASDYGRGHRGVDLRAGVGEQVLAAGAGVVSYAGMLAGRGVVAVMHADGLRTTYEPLSASVRVGQQVDQGDVLGQLTAGHASCRLGTHCLHWGLRRGEAYLDPLTLVAPTDLRLLPIGREALTTGRGSGRAGARAAGSDHAPDARAQEHPARAVPARDGAAETSAGEETGGTAGRFTASERAMVGVAVASLAAGLGMLVGRPADRRSAPFEPPRGPSAPTSPAPAVPVDLEAERRRRRAA